MGEITLKKELKRKVILQSFLFVCSLFISVNAFTWGKDCCVVSYEGPDRLVNVKRIKIYFKFFEYCQLCQKNNSFIENLTVLYSTDGGNKFIFLMAASSANQQNNTWAWIDMNKKRSGSKIYLHLHDHFKNQYVRYFWEDGLKYKLFVDNHIQFKNQTWLSINWHISPLRRHNAEITHIRILTNWNEHGDAIQSKYIDLLFPLTLRRAN